MAGASYFSKIMKLLGRLGRGGLLAAMSMGWLGCYESDFPLDPTPRVDMDTALLGTWRCLPVGPSADEEAATFVVSRTTERVYGIEFEQTDEEPERYEAYLSRLQSETVLNVRNLGGSDYKPWVYARYFFLRPTVIQVELASDKLLDEVERTPTAVRAALEKLRDAPDLFEGYCVCLRATEEREEVQSEGAVQSWR